MTENPREHVDPNPARPSQAEGEASEEERPTSGAVREEEAAQSGASEPNDPSSLRPSQAEGESRAEGEPER